MVDDSPAFCQLLTGALRSLPGVQIVGVAYSAEHALRVLPHRSADLVTLDVLLPGLDGIGTLSRLRSEHPQLKVLMVSSRTSRGAEETVRCLQLGASDYLLKPVGAEGARELREALASKLEALLPAEEPPPPPPVSLPSTRLPQAPTRIDAIGIASSTGGPAALSEVLPRLPRSFPLPLVIVQHILADFTEHLARSLAQRCEVPVELAHPGVPLAPNRIYLAPSGAHCVVARTEHGPTFARRMTPPVQGCRPAADVLFRSMAQVYGSNLCVAVLTGIGSDGCEGSRAVREAGGWVVAQDPREAVAAPMPSAVIQAGLADEVASVTELSHLLRDLSRLGPLKGRPA